MQLYVVAIKRACCVHIVGNLRFICSATNGEEEERRNAPNSCRGQLHVHILMNLYTYICRHNVCVHACSQPEDFYAYDRWS